MTAEVKMRTLAKADATLQGIFGTGPFRWFDVQLPPGYIDKGPCARVRRLATTFIYCQEGLNRLNNPRFQLDVLAATPTQAFDAAAAIINWLGTVDFASNDQFMSPPVTPTQCPNFVISQRAGLDYQLDPPVPVVSIDFRIWNVDIN